MLDFALGMGFAKKNLLSDAIIYALFANGEQGAVYCPYDLTDEKLAWVAANPSFTAAQFMAQFPNHTLFQNHLGTIPVTGHNQPVGLVLDKSGRNNHASQSLSAARPLWQTSIGNVYGDELVTNPDFSDGFNGWTLQATTSWQLTTNGARWSGIPSDGGRDLRLTVQVDKWYEIELDIFDYQSGQVRLWAGLNNSQSSVMVGQANGRYKALFFAVNPIIAIHPWTGLPTADFSITNVSIREISNPYHAIPISGIGLSSFWFDGVDDHLLTVNPMDLSGTSEVSVFVGIRKERDKTVSALLEFTSNSTTGSGSFGIFAPLTERYYQFRQKGLGSTVYNEFEGIPELGSGYPHVLSSNSSLLAGGQFTARVNNEIRNQSPNPDGGNYANDYLYIGARAGASFYFQGHIYGLIIRSTLTPEDQAEPIRQLLADRSGVTI